MTTNHSVGDKRLGFRQLVTHLQWLLCALVLLGTGLGCTYEESTFNQKATEEELAKEIAEVLALNPPKVPDTPEEIAAKEAWIDEQIPEIRELMDQAGDDLLNVDEFLERAQKLTATLPFYRPGLLLFIQARLQGFLTKQVLHAGDDVPSGMVGVMKQKHEALVDISTAYGAVEHLRHHHPEHTEEELQLIQDVYFHRARTESAYARIGDIEAAGRFKRYLVDLSESGFSDLERFKTDPTLKLMFTYPDTATAMQATAVKIEAAAQQGLPTTDTPEDEDSTPSE